MRRYLPVTLIIALALAGCGRDDDSTATQKVNGSVHVTADKQNGEVSTVNGAIHVDDNVTVTTAQTVNGGIHMGARSTASSLKTVNGGITLDPGAHVTLSVSSVNGSLALKDGAEVTGMLSNMNGKIDLNAAHVAGGIKTVNGSISINGNSHVEGGILVQKSSGGFFSFGNNEPRIVIGPGATVQGHLQFERKVRLYVSDQALIGPVSGATPIRFSGQNPPQ